MVDEGALRLDKTDFEGGGQAPLVVFVEVALDGATRKPGQTDDLCVRQGLALEPKDFQLLLDTRVRVGKPLFADGGQVVLGKGQVAHGRNLSRRFLRVSPQRLAARPPPGNVSVPPASGI